MPNSAPSPKVTSNRKAGICPKCTNVIHNANDGITCTVCHQNIHVACADGKLTAAELTRIRDPNSQIFYTCIKGAAHFKTRNPLNSLDTDERVKRVPFKHALEVSTLKQRLTELEASKALSDNLIRDQTRQLEQISKKAISQLETGIKL